MANQNFKPNTIFCSDNLPILQKINSECIDLIYLDPPFNKKKKFSAPIGSSAEGAEFLDYFTMGDVKEQWVLQMQEENKRLHIFLTGVRDSNKNEYNYAYLVYMSMRLIECWRILKPTGSLYLHCDQTMSHYLRLVLDIIFGEDNFQNDFIWYYGGGGASKKRWGKKHDNILFCTKGKKWTFNADAVRTPHKWDDGQLRADGSKRSITKGKIADDVFIHHGVMPWAKERTGYPTQKPLALLKRIIEASSNPGDLVLDPFCGCATTCVAAQALQRKWVGIDVSMEAWNQVQERMANEIPDGLQDEKYHFRTDVPVMSHRHPNKSKHVYVISCASHPGKYKVGIAGNPQQRLGSYNTGSPERDYAIEFSVETEFYAECESYVHRTFNADHEWVTSDKNEIIKAIKTFIKNPDVGTILGLQKSGK